MRRREFIGMGLGGVAAVGLGAAFWDDLFASAQSKPLHTGEGYGPLAAPDENGFRLARGFRSRLVARGGQVIPGTGYRWHLASDGMASFPDRAGGFVLVSNSETIDGGASALRFGPQGEPSRRVPHPFGHDPELLGRWNAVGDLALVRGGRGRTGVGVRSGRAQARRGSRGDGHLQA